MKKRLLPLLVLIVAIVLATAPVAMADHCRKCNATGTRCAFATTGGKPTCTDTTGVCMLSGTTCSGPHPFIEEPLGSEFTVASVERLDEPKTNPASDTRVASLETAPAPTR